MKITHFSNSFISIESNGKKLICDPWVGKANSGGWQSYPEFSFPELAAHLEDARWIYISHLHDDHFHPDTLVNCRLLDRQSIVKKFDSPVLKNRLKRLGVTNILELEPFTINTVGPFQITIFPQMTSNSSGLEDDVNFDMDTSIVIKDDKTVFFNQVDNPLSLRDLLAIYEYILRYYGEIDIACLMSGAASEYPHLFLNVNQESEKNKIVASSLKDLIDWLKLLTPKYFFPAGGTYLIPGWMSIYNNNIAQPNFNDISHAIKIAGLPVKPCALEGGKFLDLISTTTSSIGLALTPLQESIGEAINFHSDDEYSYVNTVPPPIERLLEVLNLAQTNWRNKVDEDSIEIHQSILLEIHKDLKLKLSGAKEMKKICSFELYNTKNIEMGQLKIHIDQRALFGCLIRAQVWNGVLGSLCLFERSPNVHYPADFFSLNYLVLSREQCADLEVAS